MAVSAVITLKDTDHTYDRFTHLERTTLAAISRLRENPFLLVDGWESYGILYDNTSRVSI